MNKYSQSVINNFTNEKNVTALFAALLRKYVAEYGPSDDIKCLLNSENNRSRMIRAYIDRVKNDLMYFGVTNPRVEDQVSYLNYEFTTEHLPLLYELSLKATNGWGGIAPMPSQKMNDEYSVSTRSMVSDAAREVVSDSNTHQSKYITNQTDNAPWKSPEQLVRESANKTLESWRYTSRPREMRDDRVGTLNLTPDTYAGALTTSDTNKRPNHNYDTFNNVGYSRKQPQGLDRGFAPNFPQCDRRVASAPLRKPNGGIEAFNSREGFAGSSPVAAANLHPNSNPLSDGSFRFDTCSANPGEEYNKQFTDYIGPNVGTDNGLVVGNKWYFNKKSTGLNKNSVIGPTQNMNLTTGRNQTLGGGVRSTISCGIAGEYGGVNAQMNMNTPGRPYNATGNVDYGGETYDGVDDEPGTTYKKTDVPHLPSETQQHYRQLLDAPYMHLLNSGETPDLDPFVGNARLRSYNPNTATTSADNNYKINKNEYPLSQKYVPMKNSLYDDGASANIKSNKNNSNSKNANTNSKNANSKNTNSKNANSKSVSITIGNSDKTINIGNTSNLSANKNSNNVSTKNASTKNTSTEHYYGQRPSSIIPNMKTCSAEDTPGAVFMGGALNGYKPPCFTFNVEASGGNSKNCSKYTTEYSQFGDMKSPLSAPNLRGPNDPLMATRNVEGQYMESNRPKTWTDGAGFVDQTDPKAMRRLLERRNFRTYGDVATGKYIEQTDPNISLDIFWSGQVYNNQTPFWERGLYQRRYDYDAEEAVGGFEMGNFQRGYDMSSLKSRVDNARKSYGKFDSYKVW